jgi:hypothetical protein
VATHNDSSDPVQLAKIQSAHRLRPVRLRFAASMAASPMQSFVVGNAFYITEQQAEKTPSREDGVSRTMERRLRVYGSPLFPLLTVQYGLPNHFCS